MMILFVSMFGLTVVGLILYLYVAGALQAFHLRPFRLTMYLLVLMCAMSVGIELIRYSAEGCCPPFYMWIVV
jgi:hypothetical protein